MMRQTLSQLFREDVAGLPSKEAQALRRLWHATATRYLHILGLTCDQPPEPKPDADGITTVPFDAFFLARSEEEFKDLYRLTKPKRPPLTVKAS